MSDELGKVVDSQLSKYLTAQSGYMAFIVIILIPFIKTFVFTGDFTQSIPLDTMLYTITLLGMLIIANYKDKRQEHSTATAALTNPKVTEAFLDGLDKIATGIKASQDEAIRLAVTDCLKDISVEPKVIERIVEVPVDRIVEVPVEKIIYIPKPDNTTGD